MVLEGRPEWLRVHIADDAAVRCMRARVSDSRLSTVCQSARCPNLNECWGQGTATLMLLGDTCTRGCRFCGVERGVPRQLDPDEPERVAALVAQLNLKHVVLTSVTRDDLSDGGAAHWAATVRAVRRGHAGATIECLIPDFQGDKAALATLLSACPHVVGHNIETVERLQTSVRARATYLRSLDVLRYCAQQGVVTKSGLMLGLGETDEEVDACLRDLRHAGVRILTLGQYLAPSSQHWPVERFVSPADFRRWESVAHELGFAGVAAGPLVRSSYRARELLQSVFSCCAGR